MEKCHNSYRSSWNCITSLDTYIVDSPHYNEDPFADLVVEAPEVPRQRGRRAKRWETGDGKGPLFNTKATDL